MNPAFRQCLLSASCGPSLPKGEHEILCRPLACDLPLRAISFNTLRLWFASQTALDHWPLAQALLVQTVIWPLWEANRPGGREGSPMTLGAPTWKMKYRAGAKCATAAPNLEVSPAAIRISSTPHA
jgi:hypothetical protein